MIVSVHVGEAGVRMGEVIWDHVKAKSSSLASSASSASLFREMADGKRVPRAVFVDMDPSSLDGLRSSYDCVSGREDASNNFARGYCSSGRLMMEVTWDRISRMMEACDSVQGLLMTHSTSGGTGAGLGALLSEKLDDEYPRVSKMGFQVIPSPQVSNTIVEPYNTTLCHHFMMDHIQTKVMVDNEALYDICMLRHGIERPGYTDLNKVIAKVVGSITHQPFNDYYTNLIPYPRIHYVTCAFAETDSPYGMTREVLELKNRMVKSYGKPGKWISAYLVYKGHMTVTEINRALIKYRDTNKIPFVDWSPVGIKCSFDMDTSLTSSSFPNLTGTFPTSSSSASLLVNDTVIKESFMRNNKKFEKMWNKGAFVHWYLQEGMETGEFVEAQENMAALELDYQEMES